MSVVYCTAVNVQCSAVYLLRWSLAQCMSRYRTLALSMLTASDARNIYSDLVTHKKIFWWLGCPPLPLSLPLLQPDKNNTTQGTAVHQSYSYTGEKSRAFSVTVMPLVCDLRRCKGYFFRNNWMPIKLLDKNDVF